MKILNKLYRGIDRTTDVLSFPMCNDIREIPTERVTLLGDIVINLNAAKRQSSDLNVTFSNEVFRLLIHGFLHLLGYDHEKNRYHAQKMKEKDKELRNALKTVD